MPTCPICGNDSKPRAENKAAPFCTPRCKAVDLGKWLDEAYRVPTEPTTPEEEAAVREAGEGRGDMRN
jgi:endogenous inhibitor of DNA gyrase (YacG/DUF329 family)